ncbi:hypothetical protein HYFRA_00012654 [Hymenoscyphus fraxineus]|uniref:TLC domain-containing protein n=1 Tax=Hymenoscyphus fraxineus TaxID=746836 RepID=A0A9N9LAH3_9HELO|nr:hypothetical protein HYFRA_00012654 [Hymenoscyphus fraxineus]
MHDPFPSPPPSLVKSTLPWSSALNLTTLPLHIHEILFAWTTYHLIFHFFSPFLSSRLSPTIYTRLPRRTRIKWDACFTSFVQSCFIVTFALFVIWKDEERKQGGWMERIHGYTGSEGAVQACVEGYFLWDLVVSVLHFDLLGIGSLMHAMSALMITTLGFRPFAIYYGMNFILYELSTPFLNIHWFCDKLNLTGSNFQLYNGLVLLTTFFCSRIIWGNYQSFNIYRDVWAAVTDEKSEMSLPVWLAFIYCGCNTVLSMLNIYWFGKMVQAVARRFSPAGSKGKSEKFLKEKEKGGHFE